MKHSIKVTSLILNNSFLTMLNLCLSSVIYRNSKKIDLNHFCVALPMIFVVSKQAIPGFCS
ncbi:MAG TPA: hypothetical protein DCE77_00285 [Methylophaga sp.]|nr:hypothetical protein [Methylophaga sp.]HBX59313.1 hypothetical protein [Methylophaga sp.]